MASYLITGVSRGIGYELLRQSSSNPKNTVIGLVRDKATTEKKISEDENLKIRTNIHVLQADIIDYAALKAAAEETAKITGGTLDYVIGNAGWVSMFDNFDGFRNLASDPEGITKTMRELNEINVTGNIHLLNLFTPLLLKGQTKKAVVITSGFADPDFTNEWEVAVAPLYAVSKAAVNMVIAKFNAEYKKDGVLFMAVCPGMVDTGLYVNVTEEQMSKMGALVDVFQKYAPTFKGPETPEQSVNGILNVIETSSIENGRGGVFISHYGNKTWIQ